MKAKIILLSLFLSGTFFSLFSTTYYVRSTGGFDTNDGLTSGTAFQSLAKVFSGTPVLNNGDVIDISGTFDYYVGKTITKSITIQGTDKTTAIIQGLTGSKKRCFGIGDATNFPTVTIENVTLRNFDYFDDATSTIGGAINVTVGSSLICRNVNFLNNQAYSGGAIANAGSATFEDCYFYANKTIRRTGATNADGAAINVSTTTGDVSLTIKRCLFEANSTQNIASAVRFKSTSTGTVNLLVENSTFFGNMVSSPSTSTTAGCVLVDVTTTGATVKLINNTIAYNTSVVALGRAGVSIAGAANIVTLINNILYSNTNATTANTSISSSVAMKECRNNITDQIYDFAANTTASMSSDNISSVTGSSLGLAASLADNGGSSKTLSISASSVTIDAGYATGVPMVDQRNFARIGNPDVGAYEYITFFRSKASGNWGDITSWQSSPNNSTWADATLAPTSKNGLVNILNGHEIVIAANATSSVLTINSGGKLTLNSGYSLGVTGNFTIQSDGTNSSGTFVDKSTGGLMVSGITIVKQHLTAGRNWYITSPVTGAKINDVFNVVSPGTNNVYRYDETNGSSAILNWPKITDNTTTMNVVQGYVANMASDGTVTFSGTLNTGDQSIVLTRTVGQTKEGFNLVGNPYPSYVNWMLAIDPSNTGTSNLMTTLWYRTINPGTYVTPNVSSYYVFDTYNQTANMGTNNNGGGAVTQMIPPLQAFWVRVKPTLDGSSTTGTLKFTNEMRDHESGTNRLKSSAAKNSSKKVVRLQVSNSVTTDETIILFDTNASNGYDDYDSPKYSNGSASIPEIFTIANGEQLVINGMDSIPYDTELPLGFTSGRAGSNFSMKALEVSSFDTGTKIILKDYVDVNNPVIADLSDGSTYTFSSGVTSNNTTRFKLIFKAPSVSTSLKLGNKDKVWISSNTSGQIIVNGIDTETSVAVYNEIGRCVATKNLTSTVSILDSRLVPGVYFVTLNVAGSKTTKKVIIKL